MRDKLIFVFLIVFFSVGSVLAISDISVFQGQYHNETSFIHGTFEFVFDIYDSEVGGNLVGSHKTNLTTGSWGQWKAEIPGVSAACDDTTKDYFIEILIDGNVQSPRKRLSHFNYLRKDVDEETSGDISSLGRIGAEEYTYVPPEGNSISESFFNFVSPFGGDLIRISPREDFLGFPNTTSIFVISENESYVGMTHFINPLTGLPGSWLWSDVHDGTGGFVIINTEDLPVGKEYTVKGSFADNALSLGGVSNNPQGDNSAGMDFIIYKDANATKAFFVDSANSYATTINTLLNVTDTAYFNDVYVNNTRICLADGTNCIFSMNGVNGTNGTNGINGINGTDGDTWFSLVSGWLSYVGNIFINGNINASGNIYSNNKLVCLEDGTNCQTQSFTDTNCTTDGSCGLITYDSELNYTIDTDTSASTECTSDEVLLGNGSCISSSGFGGGSGGIQYISFISTVDGKLNKNDRYLALGTDGGISGSATEMAWIIDRDMTITGILWDSKSNSRTKTSAITLMSGSSKNSLSDTSLSKDIQGVASGSDLTFSVSLSQGDVVAIKYDSGGNGGDVEDLSITLIGTYD